MANHYILDNQARDITANDTWQAIEVAQLPDGIASREIELSELLHKQEKLDIILPLTDVLATAEGLLHETLTLIAARCSRVGLWAATDVTTEQLDALLALQKDKDNSLLHALDLIVFYMPAFADGRSFSQIKHLRMQGYDGEIRVAGAYGRDQIAYLLRAGVDTFSMQSSQFSEDIHTAFVALPSAYSGDNASRLPMFR